MTWSTVDICLQSGKRKEVNIRKKNFSKKKCEALLAFRDAIDSKFLSEEISDDSSVGLIKTSEMSQISGERIFEISIFPPIKIFQAVASDDYSKFS